MRDQCRKQLVACAVVAWFTIPVLWLSNRCAAQEAKPLLSGKVFEEALGHRRSLNIAGGTLRRTVTDLQSRTGIAVILDRRTDPTTVVNIATDYETTREVLVALATTPDLSSVSITDQYVLIGPMVAARRLRTLRTINKQTVESLRRDMDSEMYRRLVQPAEASWRDLAAPRQLLIDRATAIGLTIQNPETVPHDLWAAATLPDLPFSDFSTLILNQFDLTFELFADGQMKFVAVPDDVSLERRHRVSIREKQSILEKWERAFPDLNVTWKGSTATVSATVETHEALQDFIDGKSKPKVAAASIQDRKFTMKVPAGTAMGQLIVTFRKSGVPIRIEGRSETELALLLRETTEFDLKGVTGEDFFPQVFALWKAEVDVGESEVVVTFPGN